MKNYKLKPEASSVVSRQLAQSNIFSKNLEKNMYILEK